MTKSKGWTKKGSVKVFWNGAWKTKKGKNLKFVDAGGYRNEREVNWRFGIGRQRRGEKESKFAIGTGKCGNIKNLYINK